MTGERRRSLTYAAGLTVAVGALAGVLARMTILVPLDLAVSTVEARFGATLVTVLVAAVALTFVAAFTVVPLYGVLSDRVGGHEVPWLVFVTLGIVVCFAVGFVGIQPFAGEFADATTENRGGWGGPAAAFASEERTTDGGERLVVVTHDGGEPVLAEAVTVRGEGFAAVDGADQTGPGPWRGGVSGERPRLGGRAIVEGDSIEIGVTDGCEIRLVYAETDQTITVFYHECGGV